MRSACRMYLGGSPLHFVTNKSMATYSVLVPTLLRNYMQAASLVVHEDVCVCV